MSYDTMPEDSNPDIRRILKSILVEQTARPSASKLCKDDALSCYISSAVAAIPPRNSLSQVDIPAKDTAPLNTTLKKTKDEAKDKKDSKVAIQTPTPERKKKSKAVAKMLQSVAGSVRPREVKLDALPEMSPTGGRNCVVSSPPKVKAKQTTVRHHPPPPPPPPPKEVKTPPAPDEDSADYDYEDDFEDEPNNSDSGDYFDDEDDYDDDFESFEDTELLKMKELVGLDS
eukprot:TRINITY_DN7152_c0_g1_i1.p1 TRINITY_DN7152_c0_g1~~TRINITY_DN7152_c0_g1_i1.p1  ORF type:complete len:229 (+),score=72.93 TRINITY_DN7152_c0_g1_i1:934-1620(+)